MSGRGRNPTSPNHTYELAIPDDAPEREDLLAVSEQIQTRRAASNDSG